ncbi:hypothetical protein Xen7305DRAFT_00018230 [Xenococcus sp. PCC 7305]|uniref:hypothetical protein n=1 Tax=Xenococcus sp. PCC 7305 TaxID=102125 RepID=UPI0002AC42FD|nr:hypothetical protein [Xenococcus sp. PCC 7305]ELS02112.1 hypothetical protein Xen7305DRAFT_00018230 [Xenococcus sp. PCC 7305]
MRDPNATETRINKEFIKNNRKSIKKYALKSQKKFGHGIIVINSTLVQNKFLTEGDLIVASINEDNNSKNEENTLIHPVSYIAKNSFWFKILRIKIKKKYKIDIKTDYDLTQKFLLVFVKDSSLESFSIYSIRIDKSNS